MHSESRCPHQRTKKHWTPPLLVETICSSKIVSICSLHAYSKFRGVGIERGMSTGLETSSLEGVQG